MGPRAVRIPIALCVGLGAMVVGGMVSGGCDFSAVEEPVGRFPSVGPNILLIVVDTLGAEHLGSYGAEGGVSPNLDRLASEGKRFANTYAPAPWTQPSIASLFTGRMPSAHALENLTGRLAKDHSTLAERFEAAQDRLRVLQRAH